MGGPPLGGMRRLDWSRAALASGLALALIGQGAAAQGPRVVRLSDSIIEAEPGTTTTLVMRVINEGPTSTPLRSRVTLPPGWRAVMADPPFTLPPGTGDTRLLAVTIPARAPPGPYLVRYEVVRPGTDLPLAGDSAVIMVGRRRQLRLLQVSAPRFAPAGDEYRLTFELTNLGNASAGIRLELVSADQLPARVDSTSFHLSAGTSRMIPVVVSTSDHVDRTTNHRVELRVHEAGEDHGAAATPGPSVTTLVAIIPRASSNRPPSPRLPVELRLRAGSPRDAESAFEVFGGGTLSPGGTARLDFLARGPQRGPSLNGTREEYQISLVTDKLTLRAGDQVYSLSPLSELGRYAVGGEGRARIGAVTAGGFLSRPRGTTRAQEEQAGFLSVAPVGGVTLSAQGLTHPDGDRGSLWTVRGTTGFRALAVDLEYGQGVGRYRTEQAFSAHATGAGSRIWYDLQHLRVDPDYPGSFRGQRRDFASLGVQPWRAFQMGASVGRDENSPLKNAATGVQYRRVTGWGYLGFTDRVTLEFRHSASRHGIGGTPSADQSGTSVRLRLGGRLGPVALYPSAEIGELQNRRAATRRPFHRVGMQANLQSGSTFLHASAEYASGDVAATESRRNLAGSFHLATRLFAQTRVRVSLSGIRDLEGIRRATGTVDAMLDQGLPWGHRLVLQGRTRYTDESGSEGRSQVLIEYVIRLGVPLPRDAGGARVTGRVLDVESGRGLSNVLVRIGGQTVLTDGSGRYVFSGFVPGSYLVDLDLTSIGAERIVLGTSPRAIDVREGLVADVVFEVIRAASISGTLRLAPAANLSAANDTLHPAGRPVGNALVELTGSGPVVRWLTDAEGQFQLTGLRPGRWILRLGEAALPAHWGLPNDSLILTLRPGHAGRVALTASEQVRPVRIIATGEVVSPSVASPDHEKPDVIWYVVSPRDRDLSDVAREVYGDSSLWPKIWLANRSALGGSSLGLRPGLRLRIPPKAPLTIEEEGAADRAGSRE